MNRLSIFFLILFFPIVTFAQNPTISRVIYVTFDGTRWQDIFLDHHRLPTFWEKYAKDAHLYGEPNSNTRIEVASIPISLPSYQSQMSGEVQPCDGNTCGRIHVETLIEKMLIQLGLNKKDAVTFASWPAIDSAVEHIEGATFYNTGNNPVYDPETHEADAVMADLNQQQAHDHPLGTARYDKYTFAQALHYLEKYQPKFLWISLLDADSAAHEADSEGYHNALFFYDDALDTLFTKLKQMHLDQETLVIVTTDHGRGNGIFWTSHGPEFPESKQTWAFVFNGELKPIAQDGEIYRYSTLSIRPTIAAALGVG